MRALIEYADGAEGVRAGELFVARRVGRPDRVVRIESVHHRAGHAPWAKVVECHRNGAPYGGSRGKPFRVQLTFRGGRWEMPADYVAVKEVS